MKKNDSWTTVITTKCFQGNMKLASFDLLLSEILYKDDVKHDIVFNSFFQQAHAVSMNKNNMYVNRK